MSEHSGVVSFVLKPTVETDEWREDCQKWRGALLVGKFSHWCHDWDYLPVDETTPELACCHCYDECPCEMCRDHLAEAKAASDALL